MKHLAVLSSDELQAVQKFQEYGATYTVGYGNKATWADLVHSNAYSDAALTSELTKLKSRAASEDNLEDEDLNTPGYNVIFSVNDGQGKKVNFYTKDCLNFIRAARKVRKYFKDAEELAKREAELEAEIQKLVKKTTTPTERLAQLQAQLSQLRGEAQVTVAPTPNVDSDLKNG